MRPMFTTTVQASSLLAAGTKIVLFLLFDRDNLGRERERATHVLLTHTLCSHVFSFCFSEFHSTLRQIMALVLQLIH